MLPFDFIWLSAVGVIGYGGTLEKDKVQVCCRSQIVQIIVINGIAVLIGRFYPFPCLFLICQASSVFYFIFGQSQKLGHRISVFILLCVIYTDKLTGVIGVCFLHNSLNFQRFSIHHIGGKLIVNGDMMTV